MARTADRRRRVALAAAGVVALWLAADFGYSRIVGWRHARWEASIERDADGVQAGAAAYGLGEGSVALLLVHGIGDSPRQWHKMAPTLAAEGLTCRVMRMPGFGEPIERYAVVTRERWVAAVRDELHEILEVDEKSTPTVAPRLVPPPRPRGIVASPPPKLDASVPTANCPALPVCPVRAWPAAAAARRCGRQLPI